MATVRDLSGNSPVAGVEASVVQQYVQIKDGITAPATKAGLSRIYVDTADGDLKIKYGDGTVKLIVADT